MWEFSFAINSYRAGRENACGIDPYSIPLCVGILIFVSFDAWESLQILFPTVRSELRVGVDDFQYKYDTF